jgi:hypothetical protein
MISEVVRRPEEVPGYLTGLIPGEDWDLTTALNVNR